MDHRRRGGGKDSYSYSNLFNLESLMNYKVPQPDDEFDYYGNSSQDESRGSQGAVMANYGNGGMSEREMSLAKRKRRSNNSDGEEEDGFYGTRITEDRYRSMLGEHIQKYKRRIKDTSSSPVPAPPRTAIPLPKSGLASLRTRKLGNEQRGGLYDLEATSDWPNDSTILKRGDNHEPDVSLKTYYEPALLDIGEGPPYIIPPPYNKLAPSLNLPSFSDLRVEEFYLKGTLDLGSLATLIASDKRFGPRSCAGMGETWTQYESLQAKLKALTASNSAQNFSLKISDAALKSSIPEGAAGNIQRYILSEGGALQVYYVKVLEKGDTYEIIERSLPKKPKVKKDPSVIEREEMEKISKVWVNIVRRDIPRHHKVFTTFHRKQLIDAKRFSESCQREVKVKVSRSLKMMRGAGIRTRKLARDMLLFWKRVDKEMADLRKKQEREAAEARKRELELREARRQEQRLNFLIQQTEIYSHFMQNSSYIQPSDVLSAGEDKQDGQGMLLSTSEPGPGGEEDPEDAELRKKALNAARDAVLRQKKITSDFDAKYSKLRQGVDSEDPLADSKVGVAGDMDLQTPSTMPITSTVKTPQMFRGSLKEYQLKGLQWLVNCYEKGLNGILADEMGLGKTIQAMAFLAHLAEEKDTWGPFLVVAPASVLNNWADEISRFCPDLKTLPYWGGLQERVVLRKKINARTPGFHILITSYQLLVTDEKYLKRVKWNFIILDEAQAIKSSASIRWNTLKKFECRNRLLLTGTPIQNNMAELWALLHFIMPELFNDHEQFDEWFSKGIENHAERGGTLNEHQLNRLHAILKPFMLRRVKKDVVSELTRKTEVMVHCRLSSRQQAFYQAIKNKISLAELFDGNRGHLNEKKIMNLMNIVIQLRKVCNHPELFERNVGSTYLYFAEQHNSLLPHGFGELEDIYYSGSQNPILYQIPKLILNETLRSFEACSSAVGLGIGREWMHKHFNIYSPQNVYRSVFAQQITSCGLYVKSGAFGFTHLMDLSPAEVAFLATGSFMERLLFSTLYQERPFLDGILDFLMEEVDNDSHCNHLERGTLRAVTRMLLMPSRSEKLLAREYATGPVDAPYEALVVSHQDRLRFNIQLLHSTYKFIPKARAPPICAHCSDRNFSYKIIEELHQPWIKRLLVGFARTSEFNGPKVPLRLHPLIEEIDSGLPVLEPALQLTYRIFGSCPPMQSFDSSKLLTDSGKLQTLDILLKRLRAENHRVLLFAQMTKMLNILEDYMNYKKYKYLRLDGSSSILERREMVRDFQHRNDIFVFLLSTRAGGLGINLTAADTVIFYESDWNPTLDLQAMDRAHRLGQTKDVTVYRLICKDTVEEKILLRASQKNTVQQLVMTGGRVQFGDLMAPDDVVSLVLDDPELQQKFREISLLAKERQKRHPTKAIKIDAEGDATLADWTEEGNDPDAEQANSNSKKRKAASDQKAPARSRNSQKKNSSIDYDYELDEPFSSAALQSERPRRPKRPKKSINENLEPAFTAAPTVESSQTENPPINGIGSTPSNT